MASALMLRRVLSRRTRWLRLSILCSVYVFGYISTMLVAVGFLSEPSVPDFSAPLAVSSVNNNFLRRRLLFTTSNVTNVAPTSTAPRTGGEYPTDLFTLEEKRHGAVILHVLGMMYMFVALAIVCDEFFVPALGVITEKLDLTEDVAGATFMAAGGSAPELFTSIIGVFIAHNDVGIGTIVGSAVFNILFVIGMCAIFSKETLHLTWWPLFRDMSFYSVDLIVLVVFFLDDKIFWYEALVLLSLYAAYVIFMKFNSQLESKAKALFCCCEGNKVASMENLLNERLDRRGSAPSLASDKLQDTVMKLQAVASLHMMIDPKEQEKNNPNVAVNVISNGKIPTSPAHNESVHMSVSPSSDSQDTTETGFLDAEPRANRPTVNVANANVCSNNNTNNNNDPEAAAVRAQLEMEEPPLDMSWPKGWRKRVSYICLMPIIFPLWLVLPDVRRPESRRWYMVSFFGSIAWIAIFSYLMVWWANETGLTIGISPEVMGLTILAAGTSIPDLITSVIVAKKGFGDMAVSSSVGSNIFDITVGLPFPWLLYGIIWGGKPLDVSSDGLLCAILLLFAMLIALIIVIALFRWKMSRLFGASMLLAYALFLVVSVMFELNILRCPRM